MVRYAFSRDTVKDCQPCELGNSFFRLFRFRLNKGPVYDVEATGGLLKEFAYGVVIIRNRLFVG
jgi:hypothetical protein